MMRFIHGAFEVLGMLTFLGIVIGLALAIYTMSMLKFERRRRATKAVNSIIKTRPRCNHRAHSRLIACTIDELMPHVVEAPE